MVEIGQTYGLEDVVSQISQNSQEHRAEHMRPCAQAENIKIIVIREHNDSQNSQA